MSKTLADSKHPLTPLARELALNHRLHRPPLRDHTLKHLRYTLKELSQAHASFQADALRGTLIEPAANWLLDHWDFIETQVLWIQDSLTRPYRRALPRLDTHEHEPRMLTICQTYLHDSHTAIDISSFLTYLSAYQEVTPLTIAELWAAPLLLSLALLHQLAALMKRSLNNQEAAHVARSQAELWLSLLSQTDDLRRALNRAERRTELFSPSSLAALATVLREAPPEGAFILTWLEEHTGHTGRMSTLLALAHQEQNDSQTQAGTLIMGLHEINHWNWREYFLSISRVEDELFNDPAGIYPQTGQASQDFLRHQIEYLARRLHHPEPYVAAQANRAAHKALEKGQPLPFTHNGYYLYDPKGQAALAAGIASDTKGVSLPWTNTLLRHPSSTYFLALFIFFISFFTLFSWLSRLPGGSSPFIKIGTLPLFLLLILTASEWSTSLLHRLLSTQIPTYPLLRLDYRGGIPPEARTMVVVPILISTCSDIQDALHRLEIRYLANCDPNLHFALLADFPDASTLTSPEDKAILDAAKAGFARLNDQYPRSGPPAFYFFCRERRYNPREKRWMGWERKRGKLVEFNELLRGNTTTSFTTIVGDPSLFPQIRYVITLDADTELPPDTARRLVATMAHPINTPLYDSQRQRVISGYALIQPRVTVTYPSARASRFARILTGTAGYDPYVFAQSDPYQDLFGYGIFVGKGIYDVDIFRKALTHKIPENRVLSHDLLEGGLLRAGLATDVILPEGHPATFFSYLQRLNRWTRGDWQLLPWLLPFQHSNHELKRLNLAGVTRWQILDNLRRSVLPTALLFLFGIALSSPAPLHSPWLWLALLTFLLPHFRTLPFHARSAYFRATRLTLRQALFSLVIWPYTAGVQLDACLRTLFRLFISRRHLLQWVPFAQSDRKDLYTQMAVYLPGASLSVLLFLSLHLGTASWSWLLLPLLWLSGPFAAHFMSQPTLPVAGSGTQLSPEARALYRQEALKIWQFFTRFVTAEEHYLPPDNVQFAPPNGIAHRTSPTNIGLYLVCIVAARDLNFIPQTEMLERLEQTLTTLKALPRWHGHFYNWYDTQHLSPLQPAYVSTVDSGNFVASLLTVRTALAAIDTSRSSCNPPLDGTLPLHSASLPPAPSDSPSPLLPAPELLAQAAALLKRLDALISDTDFRFLYDKQSHLLSLGYNLSTGQLDSIRYDLMASEARLTSFTAIALGQLPAEHWYALGRTTTKIKHHITLLAWTGTMFEYLLPYLFLPSYPETLWDDSYQGALHAQIDHARKRSLPWGISESGYYAFDFAMNYQYQAFGVPTLAFKRGLEAERVIAPYATLMAAMLDPESALSNLQHLRTLGADGEYGFYEALDFTPERLTEGTSYAVIQSVMSHHQGMSFLALTNLLTNTNIQSYFLADPRIESCLHLLQERRPAYPTLTKRHLLSHPHSPSIAAHDSLRRFIPGTSPWPESRLLSNGHYHLLVTESGSSQSRLNHWTLTRWREDPVQDSYGTFFYIQDLTTGALFSPTRQPCAVPGSAEEMVYALDRITFRRQDASLHTTLDLSVIPDRDAEVRRLTFENNGDEPHILQITSYLEIALSSEAADEAHPAFNKLFILTEHVADPFCLLAERRPRTPEETCPWLFQTMVASAETLPQIEWETERVSFVGRGHSLRQPAALLSHQPLSGRTGAVLDPIFALRCRLTVPAHSSAQINFVLGATETRAAALAQARYFQTPGLISSALRLAWTRNQTELTQLGLTPRHVDLFQWLWSRLVYFQALRPTHLESLPLNRQGQPGLWSLSLSGDLPIVLVRWNDRSDPGLAHLLMQALAYGRARALNFDLVFLYDQPGGYQTPVQDTLSELVRSAGQEGFLNRSGGVWLKSSAFLQNEESQVLCTAARLVLQGDGESLINQLRDPNPLSHLPEVLRPALPLPGAASSPISLAESAPLPQLQLVNGLGGFRADGAYQIFFKGSERPPAPWSNVLANPRFGTLLTEAGGGYTWFMNSRENKLTAWSNDPVLDPASEILYLRDEETGVYWPLTPQASAGSEEWQVLHQAGSSQYQGQHAQTAHELFITVHPSAPLKITRIRITNLSPHPRSLSLTAYVEWTLGVQREHTAPFIESLWLKDEQALFVRNAFPSCCPDSAAFLTLVPGTGQLDPDFLTWTVDRLEFLGRSGSLHQPAALSRQNLSCHETAADPSCGALQTHFTLQPGERLEYYLLLGAEQSSSGTLQLLRTWRNPTLLAQDLETGVAFWHTLQGKIQIETPDAALNLLFNHWLLYQVLSCRIWARTAFYQAGGALGFRDQLQDALALLSAAPDLTRTQILRHAAHQFQEGDVQHWWHEETQRGIRTRYSDDLLWLPYAVSRYVEHTGDATILSIQVPFLQDDILQPGEDERYGETRQSGEQCSLWEHCRRAIDHSLIFGSHALPLMGSGDWNDGMNRVGREGRGESVWLGFFLHRVLLDFAALSTPYGETATATHYRAVAEQLAAALDREAWDGAWYRRAFTDQGLILGSQFSQECRIDAIAQSWAVLSEAAPPERALQAMNSFAAQLYDREHGLVRLLTPPFVHSDPSPGYIQGYPPGIRENGGQYTHGILWGVLAWCQLGQGNQAYDLLHLLNPIRHTQTQQEVKQYQVEPYVVAADISASTLHPGRGGWTWYTGAAGWMYQVILEGLLGLHRQGNILWFSPCPPTHWPGYKINYTFGNTLYRIQCQRAQDDQGLRLRLDTQELSYQATKTGPGDSKQKIALPLQDDGKAHAVLVYY